MSQMDDYTLRITEENVRTDLQRNYYVMLKLAENSLTVAESLRNNYFKNTAQFVSHLRQAIQRTNPLFNVRRIDDIAWPSVQGEVVTFIDGGLGQVQISSQVPILLRVGSYCVRTGERHLAKREQFGYYPIIFGDLEGGSKERKDFPDIIRITAELLGGLSALERTPDLRLLMFHGPLVYLMNAYAGHSPFTEKDIDLFLSQYAQDPKLSHKLKEDFLKEAKLNIYPKMAPGRSDEWIERRLFEPLAWISFLYRRLIKEAKNRKPTTIITGVVERSALRQFSEEVILERIFHGLRKNDKEDYFNNLYGRTDLKSPRTLLDRLGYNDALLLAMLLQPGQSSEPWQINKYSGLTKGKISLPGESFSSEADWSCLKPSNPLGFPQVCGCYISISETTEPIRVEVFSELGADQIFEAARRAYLYARLLPGYGFPVGLDIADKYAHIPNWLTSAYSKLIKHHLGVSLQSGEINDADMRRILVQAIYMTHRDWLFRPQA
jgi:NurA domain